MLTGSSSYSAAFKRIRNRWCTAFVIFIFAWASPVLAVEGNSLELAIKATFLYKFVPFIEWPVAAVDQPNSPFNLCVVGNDPFSGQVEQEISNQRIGAHSITLRHIAIVGAQSNCQVMFIAGSSAQSVAQALDITRGSPTLTVTDSTIDPTAGIIQFVIVNDRVSFNIDAVAAAKNHLVISSKLLALAHVVNSVAQGQTQ